MPDYDFSTLSPHDFELLSRDLLQSQLKVTLESFKAGKDQGVDLRYCKSSSGDELIVQCKHFFRSGLTKLLGTLREHEVPKITKLKPAKYLLVTSVSLSASNKRDILEVLKPYCHSPADIYGKEDLNNLLGKFPEVEKLHFKLWLPSTAVLERLLNSGLFTQTALELDDIKRRLSLFVPTEAVRRGMEMLAQDGFCMLTGIPGIGKTATARVLVSHLINEGWEAIYLSNDASEAFNVMRTEERQVFFYDDFLGQTSMQEKLLKNEDRQLLQLIAACRKHSQSKRLVLTTREYLYQQAKQEHELLARSDISLNKCTVKLSDYTEKIRAEILVNHLFFYGVDAEVCSRFVASGAARRTLMHPNYNPRIVETMCEMQRARSLGGEAFGAEFEALLNSPGEIWSHAFNNQLSENARQILLVFAIMGNYTTVDALRRQHKALAVTLGVGLVGYETAFKSALEQLEGNFVSITPNSVATFVTFHTPSIKDFTDVQLTREAPLLEAFLAQGIHDQSLWNAATTLVRCTGNETPAAAYNEVMKRGDYKSAFTIEVRNRTFALQHPATRAETLERWLSLISSRGDESATADALDYIGTYLQAFDPENEMIAAVIGLYSDWIMLIDSTKAKPSPQAFAERIVAHCCDPEDFLALDTLLDRDGATEEMSEKLRSAYPSAVEEWLDAILDDAGSSEEIFGAIDTAREIAESLGVVMQLDHYVERADEKVMDEDRHADMHEDDYRADRYAERQESAEIDDILNSLRD